VPIGVLVVNVYALWEEADDVKLIFDGNGGLNSKDEGTYSRDVKVNSTQNLIALQPTDEFRLSGHYLLGWTTVKDDKSTLTNDVDIELINVTVFAYWEKGDDVWLIFNGNKAFNSIGSTTFGSLVPINSKQKVADHEPKDGFKFKRPGYKLTGWTRIPDDETTLVPEFINIDMLNVTVYALWTPGDDVLIRFNGNGGVTKKDGATRVDKYVQINSTVLLSMVQPSGDEEFIREGHFFLGWTLKPDDVNELVPVVDIEDSNLDVYALWKAGDPLMVVFHGDGGVNSEGRVSVVVSVPIFATRKVTDIQPTGKDMFAKQGFEFTHWSLTSGGAEVVNITTTTKSITIFAVWEPV
jgi:uncharacterized repeat protein (TIGR02543 family)